MPLPQTAPALLRSRPHAEAAAPQLALTLLGPSTAMAHLWGQIRRLAPHVRTLLLVGQDGCGQDAVARLLHDLSPQSHRLFLQMSAAEMESKLTRASGLHALPSDLFLFLPDLHMLSSGAQEALLQLVRQRRSRSLTVVAAAAEDLRSLVATGQFRADLAEVLGALTLPVPSLKQRKEDLPMLISQLLSAFNRGGSQEGPTPEPSEEFLQAAMEHAWPGNLPELCGALGWLCARGKGGRLSTSDLYQALAAQMPSRSSDQPATRMVSLDTIVQEHLQAVLSACRGNKLKAAEVLGISRSTLYRMLDAATAHVRDSHDLNDVGKAPEAHALPLAS